MKNITTKKEWGRMCSAKEIAADVGVHPKTASRWIRAGLLGDCYPLPCGRGGKTEFRVLTQNYFAFLDSRKIEFGRAR